MTEQQSLLSPSDNDGNQFANFMQKQLNNSEKDTNLNINSDIEIKDNIDNSVYDDHKSAKSQISKTSYQCSLCKKSFDNKSNLNRHTKNVHKKSTQQEETKVPLKSQTQSFHESISATNQDINQQQQEDQSMIQESEDSIEEIKQPSLKRQNTGTTQKKQTQSKSTQKQEDSEIEIEDTITRIKKYQIQDTQRVPTYQMLYDTAKKPSPILKMTGPPFGTMTHQYRFFKLYSLKGFLTDELDELKLNNEYLVTSTARKLDLFGIIHLEDVFKGSDHVALQYINYNYPFPYYLRYLRNHDQDQAILKQLIYAIKELHTMGFVHHRLSLENIVLNQYPIRIKLINFEESKNIESRLKIEYDGSLLFYPVVGVFKCGDKNIDYYALVSIIIALYLSRDYNINWTTQSQLIEEAKIYLRLAGASPIIKDLVKIFYLQPSPKNWYDLDEIEVKFDKLNWKPDFKEIPIVPQLKRLI